MSQVLGNQQLTGEVQKVSPGFSFLTPLTKSCSHCKQTKPLTEFCLCSKGPFGRHSHCKQCVRDHKREWRKKNPDKNKSNKLKSTYGIDIGEYNRILAAQGGVCAVCKQINANGYALSVDHCHTTGKNRSLLCSPCNTGIGQLQENPALLYRAIEYLNYWKAAHAAE